MPVSTPCVCLAMCVEITSINWVRDCRCCRSLAIVVPHLRTCKLTWEGIENQFPVKAPLSASWSAPIDDVWTNNGGHLNLIGNYNPGTPTKLRIVLHDETFGHILTKGCPSLPWSVCIWWILNGPARRRLGRRRMANFLGPFNYLFYEDDGSWRDSSRWICHERMSLIIDLSCIAQGRMPQPAFQGTGQSLKVENNGHVRAAGIKTPSPPHQSSQMYHIQLFK